MASLGYRRACRRAITLVAACAVVGGLTAVAAISPPRWLPPRDLSAKGADSVIPDVAVDSKGTAIVAWAQANDSSWTIEEVERPPGGPWSAPKTLSVPADIVASPQLAIGGGTVVVVWNHYDGKNLIVQAASRDAKTRAWSAPASLSTPGRDAQAPRIAVNSRGDAVAVWASVGFTGWTIQAASRPAGGGVAAGRPARFAPGGHGRARRGRRRHGTSRGRLGGDRGAPAGASRPLRGTQTEPGRRWSPSPGRTPPGRSRRSSRSKAQMTCSRCGRARSARKA